MGKKLYCFREYNDWEHETWKFYIGLTTEQHIALSKLIEESRQYSLSSESYDRSTVDKLVSESDSGYMAYHNYVGDLVQPLPTKDELGNDDPFYKGGIADFCSEKLDI